MRSTEDATFRDPRGGRLLRAWTLELEDEDRLSIGIAFYGFGACWLAIAIGVPYGIWFLGGFTNQNFGFWIVIVQLTIAPMQMCLSMIAVTSAMWYVSLAKRFAIAIMILVPGTAMLMFGLAQVTWIDGNDIWPRVAFQVTAFCTASALIVLPIQIWIGWSLSQARETPRRLPRVSTYQFLELTAIASVLFAIGMMVRDREIWIESLIVAIVGALTTIAALAMIVTRLSTPRRYRFAGFAIASIFTLVAATVVSLFGFSQFDEALFGSTRRQQTTVIIIASILGTMVLMGTSILSTFWLRVCGWQCVVRSSEKRDIA